MAIKWLLLSHSYDIVWGVDIKYCFIREFIDWLIDWLIVNFRQSLQTLDVVERMLTVLSVSSAPMLDGNGTPIMWKKDANYYRMQGETKAKVDRLNYSID